MGRSHAAPSCTSSKHQGQLVQSMRAEMSCHFHIPKGFLPHPAVRSSSRHEVRADLLVSRWAWPWRTPEGWVGLRTSAHAQLSILLHNFVHVVTAAVSHLSPDGFASPVYLWAPWGKMSFIQHGFRMRRLFSTRMVPWAVRARILAGGLLGFNTGSAAHLVMLAKSLDFPVSQLLHS